MTLLRDDTWSEGLAAEALGLHNGWSQIRPAYTGAELMFQHQWTEQDSGYGVRKAATEHGVNMYTDPDRGDTRIATFDQVFRRGVEHKLRMTVNINALVGWPYHSTPPADDLEDYWPFRSVEDIDNYLLTVRQMVEVYGWGISAIEIMNEPWYLRDYAEPDADQYTELVEEVRRIVPARIDVLAAGLLLRHRAPGVTVGHHGYIMHTSSQVPSPAALRQQIVDYCARLYAESDTFWLDETSPVGKVARTDQESSRPWIRAALEGYLEAHLRGYVAQVGLGFSGGLGPVWSPQWRVGATYLHPDGRLTPAAQELVSVARDFGWWQPQYEVEPPTPPPTEPPGPDYNYEAMLERAADLSLRAEVNARGAMREIKERWNDDSSIRARRMLRRVIDRCNEIQALCGTSL